MTSPPQGLAGPSETPRGDRSVTRLVHRRVTDSKSLTLPHRQRCGKPVTIGHREGYPQYRVTGTPIGVVARARVRARKATTRNTGHHRSPGGRP